MCDSDEIKAPRQIFIITAADNPPGRAGIAFAQAIHALAMGREVTIFLELDGVLWASTEYNPDVEAHQCFDDPRENIPAVLDMGGEILICSTCIMCVSEQDHGHDHAGHGHLDRASGKKVDVAATLREGIKESSFTELQEYLDEPVNMFVF